MEEKKKSFALTFYEKNLNDINYYNQFMETFFKELAKKDFTIFEGNKKEDLIKTLQSNVNKLAKSLKKIDTKQNKDIYNCLSCIFGAFLGDATGAYCEFSGPDPNKIKKIFVGNPMFGDSPGQVTDDSEMAMSNAFAIMDIPDFEELNSDYCYYYYGLWHLSKPRDEGITTRKALNKFTTSGFNPETENNYEQKFQNIKKTNDKSLANGFLMRTSPFIIWCYYRFNKEIVKTFDSKNSNNQEDLLDLFKKIQSQAMKDNICTHPNDSLCVSHSLFCIMSLGAICELKPLEILNNLENLLKSDYFDKFDIKKMILKELNNFKSQKELNIFNNCYKYFTKGDNNVNTHMGFYYHAFRLTLYYLYFFDEIEIDKKYTKFRAIMNQICIFGGDTDTNAAIVGTVIGPLIGYENFGNKEFEKMVNLVPKNRAIFSPALMIIYVYFIKSKKNMGKTKMNFLKMLLTILFEKIDTKNLTNIFSNFDT